MENNDLGRSPQAGRATLASPQTPTGLGQSESIPSALREFTNFLDAPDLGKDKRRLMAIQWANKHRSTIKAMLSKLERLEEANGILEDALQEAGDDYPGSSMQAWCRQQVRRARDVADGACRVSA